jgi:glycosyltransferase involved in cell wall biosynthesis
MLVQNKKSDDLTVIGPESITEKSINMVRPIIDRYPLNKYYHKTSSPFSIAWFPFSSIVKKINRIDPDVVHLHWICGGLFRIEELQKINAPIVWSLHDDWAFTGGCHIKFGCEKYKASCGVCPNLGSNKKNDLSRKIWNRKKKVYSKLNNLTIIGLSKWLQTCARNSSLLSGKNIINLPNPIDVDVFKPFNRQASRKLWNLPQKNDLILFGALGATSDKNKGYTLLLEGLNKIRSRDVECVVFGNGDPKHLPNISRRIHYLGQLSDEVSLVTLYNAVSVMVVPSLQENLSNTILESLACGIPVVCFDVGGNRDLVEHQVNGYLAKPYDGADIAEGIDWVLNNNENGKLSINARKKVLDDYESKKVAKRYISLYKRLTFTNN